MALAAVFFSSSNLDERLADDDPLPNSLFGGFSWVLIVAIKLSKQIKETQLRLERAMDMFENVENVACRMEHSSWFSKRKKKVRT